jgi:hypothetical protein
MKKKILLFQIIVISTLFLSSCSKIAEASEYPTLTNTVQQPKIVSTSTISHAPTLSPTRISTPKAEFIIPDSKIAYTDSNGLHIIRSTGELIADIVVDGYQDAFLIYDRPAWSPDGSKIAFIVREVRSNRNGFYGFSDIYTVKSDGSDLTKITDSPQYHKSNLSWSPDGKYFLIKLVRTSHSSVLYLLNSGNGETVFRYPQDVGSIFYWAQDGVKILFSDPDDTKLYTMDIFGDNITELGDIEIPYYSAALSPDGSVFAYSSNFQCGDIYISSLKGKNIVQITNTSDSSEGYPSWTPDKQFLLLERENTPCGVNPSDRWWNIVITDMIGNEVKLLPKVSFPHESAIWAPVPSLKPGKSYKLNALAEYLNLREEPGLQGGIITKLIEGEQIKVIEGPIENDTYYWWNIRTSDGTVGWVVDSAYWYTEITQ